MTLEYLMAVFVVTSGGFLQEVPVWYADPIDDYCPHQEAIGCILDKGIIIDAGRAHEYHPQGCTILTHEYWHLMGYAERHIPECNKVDEMIPERFRVDTDHDGIPDYKDECPSNSETFNGMHDYDGCYDATGVWKVKIPVDVKSTI